MPLCVPRPSVDWCCHQRGAILTTLTSNRSNGIDTRPQPDQGDDMDKRPIGNTGLSVTPIAFGAGPLGGMPNTYGHDVDEETARATIRAIFDSPVNALDTSRNYGFGRSEARIGAVIRERGGLPTGFVLATKLDRDMTTGRFDADQARRSAEESLQALGIDRFQILHLHDPEHARDLNEIVRKGGALETLFRMKEEGLVQATGIAMGRTDVLLPLLEDWPFDIVLNHNRFTVVNRSAETVMDRAAARGATFFNAAPFAGGVLAKGTAQVHRVTYQEANEAALAPFRAVEALCLRHAVSPGALALQFSMRDPRVCSTIVGVSRPDRVQQTLDWAAAPVGADVFDELARVGYSTQDPEADRVYVPG
jgi:D-threo-aldose 1-dehydrogenase